MALLVVGWNIANAQSKFALSGNPIRHTALRARPPFTAAIAKHDCMDAGARATLEAKDGLK